jgi:hypothetical protein
MKTIKTKIILTDFWTTFKLFIKANFIKNRNFKKIKITLILKDLNILKNEIKTIPIVIIQLFIIE